MDSGEQPGREVLVDQALLYRMWGILIKAGTPFLRATGSDGTKGILAHYFPAYSSSLQRFADTLKKETTQLDDLEQMAALGGDLELVRTLPKEQRKIYLSLLEGLGPDIKQIRNLRGRYRADSPEYTTSGAGILWDIAEAHPDLYTEWKTVVPMYAEGEKNCSLGDKLLEASDSIVKRYRLADSTTLKKSPDSVMYGSLSSSMREGLSPADSVRGFLQQYPDHPHNRVLEQLAESLDAGQQLHEAMAAHPDVFGPFPVEMAQLGEETSCLPGNFRAITEYFLAEHTLRDQSS